LLHFILWNKLVTKVTKVASSRDELNAVNKGEKSFEFRPRLDGVELFPWTHIYFFGSPSLQATSIKTPCDFFYFACRLWPGFPMDVDYTPGEADGILKQQKRKKVNIV
jgi:hypothetical protein